MDNEALRLVKTLNDFDGPANTAEVVARSGLTQGKVLGNLPKLCLAGFVDKRGKLYTLTKRGRAILGELEPVPEDKGFYFYLREGVYSGLVVHSLKDFYESLRTVDAASLEFHLQRGDFEKWVTDVLRDGDLARGIAALRSLSLSGEKLREKLQEIVGGNYKMLNILMS